MIVFGLNSTAYIGNTFAGPALAQLFLEHSSFRLAFGTFAIIVPFVAIHILFMLWLNLRKAKNIDIVEARKESGRNRLFTTLGNLMVRI